jgi:nucleoside-diphosphate-sugar epimerase
MSRRETEELVRACDPHLVLHLAARTDTTSNRVADYDVNHVGTRNITRALAKSPSVERFIFVSTQFVLGPGTAFESETQYQPHTAYGESKARAERELMNDPPDLTWTIVRPTNVWGPWHLRYQREFWRVLSRGVYVHPSSPDPIRSYGYVGSVCMQMLAALTSDSAAVRGRVLYVGDEPIHLSEWVDAFSIGLRGRRARRVPGAALLLLGRVGDIAKRCSIDVPIDSGRFASMTEDYVTPMDRTRRALGGLTSVGLLAGVNETVAWLRHGRSPNVRSWLALDPCLNPSLASEGDSDVG